MAALAILLAIFITAISPTVASAQESTPSPPPPEATTEIVVRDERSDTVIQVLLTLAAGGFGIAGVWYGHRQEVKTTRQRDLDAREEQEKSVRALLAIEIEENLQRLRDLRATTLTGQPSQSQQDSAKALILHPSPRWSRLMWESQASVLGSILSPEIATRLYRFYEGLARLTAIRDGLASVDARDHQRQALEPEIPPPISGMAPSRMPIITDFPEYARRYWTEWDTLADELIRAGNPLVRDLYPLSPGDGPS